MKITNLEGIRATYRKYPRRMVLIFSSVLIASVCLTSGPRIKAWLAQDKKGLAGQEKTLPNPHTLQFPEIKPPSTAKSLAHASRVNSGPGVQTNPEALPAHMQASQALHESWKAFCAKNRAASSVVEEQLAMQFRGDHLAQIEWIEAYFGKPFTLERPAPRNQDTAPSSSPVAATHSNQASARDAKTIPNGSFWDTNAK